MNRNLATLVLAFAVACTGGAPEEPSAAPRSFAAFRQQSMTIDRLDFPIDPPYAAGSTHSPALIHSDDPSVVAVDRNGALVAHRNGEVLVRGTTGNPLKVHVQSATVVQVVPDSLELNAGATRDVQVLGDGKPVAHDAVRWKIDDPGVATATGTHIAAGLKAGVTEMVAMVGSAQARLHVVVVATQVAFKVQPAHLTMSIGSTRQLTVPAVLASGTTWSSSNPRVLEHLHDGFFLARRSGTAQACAVRDGVSSCARIEVEH
jgi:Bacterial Ig-like domain (group 2)